MAISTFEEMAKRVETFYTRMKELAQLCFRACGYAYGAFVEFDRRFFGAFDYGGITRRVLGYGFLLRLTPEWIKNLLFGKSEPEKIIVVDCARKSANLCLESSRSGSSETIMKERKTEVAIGVLESGEFRAFGTGHRFDSGTKSWLVAPAHVISAAQAERRNEQCDMDTTFDVKGSQGIVSLDASDDGILELCTDLVAVPLTTKDCADIGVRCCKIGAIKEIRGNIVAIRGVSGKGTISTIRHNVNPGYTEYDGTTMPGYSGSGYYDGDLLTSVHMAGGKHNLGIAASYILCVLNHKNKSAPESTSEFLENIRDTKQRVKLIGIKYDEDTAQIRHNGKYHFVPHSKMAEVFGDDYAEGYLKKYGEADVKYNDGPSQREDRYDRDDDRYDDRYDESDDSKWDISEDDSVGGRRRKGGRYRPQNAERAVVTTGSVFQVGPNLGASKKSRVVKNPAGSVLVASPTDVLMMQSKASLKRALRLKIRQSADLRKKSEMRTESVPSTSGQSSTPKTN